MSLSNTTLKMVTSDQLDRRSVLKGVSLGAGAVVLQPFLNALAAEARGEAPPPRIVFVVEANGLWDHHIRPQTLGKAGAWNSPLDKLVDVPLAGHALPEPIAPLAAFKDRMSVVLGLSSKHVTPNHGGGYGVFNCCTQGQGTHHAVHTQTIDHALAATSANVIPVVGLGVSASADRVFANWLSVSEPMRPLPFICQPEVAFRMLFGSVAEGEAGKLYQARNKLLDWCRSDIRRVRDALPQMDREKLDVYLDTFEQMRSRQQKLSDIKDRLQANLPALDKFDCKRTTGRFEAQCSVAVAALASRLTNVVVIDTACGYQGYHIWKDLGVTLDGHSIGHMAGQPDREKHAVPVRRFYAERVVDLAQRMAAIKEGNGTLLDNSLIIYLSDAAEEHHGTGQQWPMVLVGNLGGRLKTAGRFLQFPGYNKAGHRTMSNFFLSLLHAVGDKREKFGEPDRELADIDIAGPLAEILA
ncbi:DUF1552 domain-containing protein [Lignipirellula cremea]|uniref:DUF1552 domain-containing protein n=1 Tax=Lignipirellula cremea TaxID=2528010 RepID=A0A518DXN7_9BACT|nr:DUF1552 domain-containing protein [Lignipirellula cremea]QDU96598.1 hypothetical protein Pla8534_44190 [Lignipirellula cremea]